MHLFSKLQNLNQHHYSDEERASRETAAKTLLDFGIACCRKQLMAGRLFAHEHPWTATSWQHASVQALGAADPTADLGAVIPDETRAVAEAEGGGRRMAVPRTMTDQATGMTTTISLRVEEAVVLLRHPRQTRCLGSWRG